MSRMIVAGTGPDVGKTIVSAILSTLFQADYWKPVQCGDLQNSDSEIVRSLIDPSKSYIFKPAYSFKAPVSPHHAARLEGITVRPDHIIPPRTLRSLVIESVGGIFVPLTAKILSIDLFLTWGCQWIVVSRHYLGSINHTLLTIDALKRYNVPLLGIIFNGVPNPDSEKAILEISALPCLGRLLPEEQFTKKTIKRYAKQWKKSFELLL